MSRRTVLEIAVTQLRGLTGPLTGMSRGRSTHTPPDLSARCGEKTEPRTPSPDGLLDLYLSASDVTLTSVPCRKPPRRSESNPTADRWFLSLPRTAQDYGTTTCLI
ncbi:hypothetical protein Bbelb_328830 [Branchiostoma belcheri]|nr:hypothetical protein Bbelb_328830 [Branchiostoma belcheri]